MSEHSKIKVAFICHGNICRSPMAKFIFLDMINKENLNDYFYVDSMATSREEIGNGIYPYAKAELDKHNINGYASHRAKQFTMKDYNEFDYIIVMDEMNKYNLMRIIKEDKDNKVHKLLDFTPNPKEIEDPWYSGNFEKVYKEIDNGCRCFLEYLKTKIKDWYD